MKTTSIQLLVLLSGMIACSPARDQEAQQALSAYTTFVDSVYTLNEGWKTTSDTEFVEVPVDVNDPSKIMVDTIVTTPEAKAKMSVLNQFFAKSIPGDYEHLKAAVEAKADKMDEKMKKEFAEAAQKFESMQTKQE
jgi:hypothetical protein